MVNINWTDEAELWLKDIHDYIALDKKTIAKKVVTEIYQKVQIL
jgi:plasmid stabilization system protein ParE